MDIVPVGMLQFSMVAIASLLVATLFKSTAVHGLVIRQASTDSPLDNSTAVAAAIDNLLSTIPPVSSSDGSPDLFEAEDTPVIVDTLMVLTPATIAAAVSNDESTSSTAGKRAVLQARKIACPLPPLLTDSEGYDQYLAGTNAAPSLGTAPSTVVSGQKTFSNAYSQGDLGGSIKVTGYMTYKTLGSTKSPNTNLGNNNPQQTTSYLQQCADYCISKPDCMSFNLYQTFGNPVYEQTTSAFAPPTYSYGVRCALYSAILTGYTPNAVDGNPNTPENLGPGQFTSSCDATNGQQSQAPFAVNPPSADGKTPSRYVENAFSLIYTMAATDPNCPADYSTTFFPQANDYRDPNIQFTGAVKAGDTQTNLIKTFVLNSYSPSACASSCIGDCTFFNLYLRQSGDDPAGYKDYGTKHARKPKGIPISLTPQGAICVTYRATISADTRENYGSSPQNSPIYFYNSDSLGCAKPNSMAEALG